LIQRSRVAFGLLSVGLVLLLNLLGASPALHEIFHADASRAGHECAVTLFAHGQVDSATMAVAPAAPVALVQLSPCLEFSVFAPAIAGLPAGRAPPAAVSSPA